MPPRREFRNRARTSGFRDAKLIVIATEGLKTEPIYFQDLVSPKYYKNPRVHLEILSRKTSASSPEHVLKSLDSFKKKYRFLNDDELWMVIDLDKWGVRKLDAIAALCLQKGYHLAASNPCFEFWLLLHIKSLSDYTLNELIDMLQNKKNGQKTWLESELTKLLGSYNKSNLDTSQFIPYINNAVQQAKDIDEPKLRWPNRLGSHVYRLVENIIAI